MYLVVQLPIRCVFCRTQLVGRVPIATNTGVPSSSTPYTMFGATASLVTTSAEDLRLFRVERVSLLPEKVHFSDKVSEFKTILTCSTGSDR